MTLRACAMAVTLALALGLSSIGRAAAQVQPQCGYAELPSGRMYYCVSGRGSDVVVLNAGARLDSRAWGPLLPALAGDVTVITFDRLGLGRSGPGATPRTPATIADEMAALLARLAPGPYVLVGHSIGGLHALWFGRRHPEQTRGIVLLDTPGPQFDRARWELLSPAERVERERLLAASRGAAPVGVQREYTDGAAAPRLEPAAVPDTIPLVVVAADTHEFGPHGDPAAHERLWQAGQRQWLEYSDRAELVIAAGATHMVHRDRPDIVMRAIRRVLRQTVH